MRIVCLAQQSSVKASFPRLPPQKKAPTEGKIVPEVTVLLYKGKTLGTLYKDLSPMKRKFADALDVWNLLNTENKSA